MLAEIAQEAHEMNFETEEVDGALVVRTPDMDLDAGNAEEFKKSAAAMIEGCTKVAMDLSGIGFMDSAGLGAILSVFKKVRANGGQFKLFGLSDEVKALFELVRMQRLLDIYPDQQTALAAFTD
jgi:anti-sigma B factor antagonist